MKKLTIFGLAILLSVGAFGQINMNDSTAQVIGYWKMNETQSYLVSRLKFKVANADTSAREFYRYAVDITIRDSTAKSYTIDWFYRDFEIQSDNKISRLILSINKNLMIKIITDEYGVFQEVVNWKEVRAHILKGTKLLKKETKNIPALKQVISQIEDMYRTKESIERGAIKEIQQYYTFHGAKYKLGEEINANMTAANAYGGDPFDVYVSLWLEELNPGYNNFLIRMYQTTDPEQLTNAAFDYMAKLAKAVNMPAPKKSDFPPFNNETWTSSRIHGSGWIIYSIETKEISAEGVTSVDERIIEIQ